MRRHTFLEREYGLPAQQSGRVVGQGMAGNTITGAAQHDEIRHGSVGHGNAVEHLQETGALTGSRIDYIKASPRLTVGQSSKMTFDKVDQTNTVTHAGAVDRV